MSKDDPVQSDIFQMFWADFSGVGSHPIIWAILSSDMNILVSFDIENGGNMQEDGWDDNIDIVMIVLEPIDGAIDKILCIFKSEVRFPITSNHSFVSTKSIPHNIFAPHKISNIYIPMLLN